MTLLTLIPGDEVGVGAGVGACVGVATGVAIGVGVPPVPGADVVMGAGVGMPGELASGIDGNVLEADPPPPPHAAKSTGRAIANAKTHEVLKVFITHKVVGLKGTRLKLLAGQAIRAPCG